ncbi:MAG: hypothetical protein JO056_07095 [Alphaproteobacteria bacterium]|nr:hypothetical protein [Alphaproteobacteria bacterium]
MKATAGVNCAPNGRESLWPMCRASVVRRMPLGVMHRPVPVTVRNTMRSMADDMMPRMMMTASMQGMATGVAMRVVPHSVSHGVRPMRHMPTNGVRSTNGLPVAGMVTDMCMCGRAPMRVAVRRRSGHCSQHKADGDQQTSHGILLPGDQPEYGSIVP